MITLTHEVIHCFPPKLTILFYGSVKKDTKGTHSDPDTRPVRLYHFCRHDKAFVRLKITKITKKCVAMKQNKQKDN